jgi:hypothetical protein
MNDRAAVESDQQTKPPALTLRHRIARLPSRWRRFGSVALVCYALVGVFGATYGIVRLISPESSTAVIWGACIAGPLALGFIWERLTGLKFFGIEASLAHAFAWADATLATALSATEQQGSSGNEAIFGLVDKVIENPAIEVLELNLRATRYWWSTRLYLQAALAEDYTKIQRLVFVDGDAQRRYVGMAAPGEVRRALAHFSGPDLEPVYLEIQNKARENPVPPDHSEARRIVDLWANHIFFKDGKAIGEEDAKTFMPAELLMQSVVLETQSVEWDKPLDSPVLQTLVLEKGVRFVPLTQNGRLAQVVNAEAFAWHMARETLRAKLS